MNSNRKSNIELLRIVSILFIIAFHYVFKSDYNYSTLNLNTYIIKSICFVGELGCNLFILITGYFYDKQKVTGSKFIKLLLEVYFYYIIGVFIGYKLNLFDELSLRDTIKLYFPITITSRYWFITAYLLLYLLSNYLNIIIDNINKNQYKKLLLGSIIIYSIIPTFFGLLYNGSEVGFFFNRFIWVIILYFIGAYIKKYKFSFLNSNKQNIMCVIINAIIMILSIKFFYNYLDFFNMIGTYEIAYLWTPNNIFMLVLSIGVFNLFLNMNFQSSIINIISSTTLGIYMIHDGPLDYYIWDSLLKNNYYLNSDFPLLYIFISSLFVFIVCIVIDLIRQELEDKTINKFFNSKLYQSIKDKTNNAFNKILSLL